MPVYCLSGEEITAVIAEAQLYLGYIRVIVGFGNKRHDMSLVWHRYRGGTLERFPQCLNRFGFPWRESSDSDSVLVNEASMDGQGTVAGFA